MSDCPKCGGIHYGSVGCPFHDPQPTEKWPTRAIKSIRHPAAHASAPEGMKCADCTMDEEPCPTCYAAWWQKRHPNTIQVEGQRAGEEWRQDREAIKFLADRVGLWANLANLPPDVLAAVERARQP